MSEDQGRLLLRITEYVGREVGSQLQARAPEMAGQMRAQVQAQSRIAGPTRAQIRHIHETSEMDIHSPWMEGVPFEVAVLNKAHHPRPLDDGGTETALDGDFHAQGTTRREHEAHSMSELASPAAAIAIPKKRGRPLGSKNKKRGRPAGYKSRAPRDKEIATVESEAPADWTELGQPDAGGVVAGPSENLHVEKHVSGDTVASITTERSRQRGRPRGCKNEKRLDEAMAADAGWVSGLDDTGADSGLNADVDEQHEVDPSTTAEHPPACTPSSSRRPHPSASPSLSPPLSYGLLDHDPSDPAHEDHPCARLEVEADSRDDTTEEWWAKFRAELERNASDDANETLPRKEQRRGRAATPHPRKGVVATSREARPEAAQTESSIDESWRRGHAVWIGSVRHVFEDEEMADFVRRQQEQMEDQEQMDIERERRRARKREEEERLLERIRKIKNQRRMW
ncbi:hypothetical protein PSPO01_13913 [Paraphaeosphaeria sporulosa]